MKALKHSFLLIILLLNTNYNSILNNKRSKKIIAKDNKQSDLINDKLINFINFKKLFQQKTDKKLILSIKEHQASNNPIFKKYIEILLPIIGNKIKENLSLAQYNEKKNNNKKYLWARTISKELDSYIQSTKASEKKKLTDVIEEDIKSGKFTDVFKQYKSITTILPSYYGILHEQYNTDKKKGEKWALSLKAILEKLQPKTFNKKIANSITQYINSKDFLDDYDTHNKDIKKFKKFVLEKFNVLESSFRSHICSRVPWALLFSEKIEKLKNETNRTKIFLNALTIENVKLSLQYSSIAKFWKFFNLNRYCTDKLKTEKESLLNSNPAKKIIYNKIINNITQNRKHNNKKIIENNKENNQVNENNLLMKSPINFIDKYIRRPKYQSKKINKNNNIIFAQNDGIIFMEEESQEDTSAVKSNQAEADCDSNQNNNTEIEEIYHSDSESEEKKHL